DAQVAASGLNERAEERHRLAPQQHAADREARAVGDERRSDVQVNQLRRHGRVSLTAVSREFEVFSIERHGALAVVRIDREEKLNAMNVAFFRELPQVLATL